MDETSEETTPFETDHRYPSGPWMGFFLQRELPGRHWMEIELTFRAGRLSGTGFDWVGPFRFTGTYRIDNGRCYLTKQYLLRHEVVYEGFNEGRGIWGKWEIPDFSHGGFHIWPKNMPDPSGSHLREASELPGFAPVSTVESDEPVVRTGSH